MATTATRPQYLSIGEVAERLRVSRASVYRSVAAGHLRAVRLNPAGALRVPAAEIERPRSRRNEREWGRRHPDDW